MTLLPWPRVAPARPREQRLTTPAPRDIWWQLMEADPHALVTQSPAWVDAICAVSGYADASRLYEFAGGRRVVLPLVRRRVPAPLTLQASPPPAWGFGGLLAAPPLKPEEVACVFADLARQPALRTVIRPNPLAAEAWAAARPRQALALPRLAHVLDLEGGFDRVWAKRFSGETRSQVRKAERSGLEVERDTTGRLMPAFYELFEQSVERWARQQREPVPLARWRARRRDPLRKFVALAQQLGEALHLWVAWSRGEPAAAILVLQGANAHYTRGAMNKSLAGPTNANDLLHSLAIQEACRAGCRHYHMGETGSAAALAHFKSRFGAAAVRYAEYRLERLPLTRADQHLRGLVKRLIGFRDA